MHRAIELQDIRRSIFLLAPGSMAMTREDALALLAEFRRRGSGWRLYGMLCARRWTRAGTNAASARKSPPKYR